MVAKQAPEKRRRLVDAAATLFYEQGFNRTTLADIAGEADVPLGNVYYYFKTKDAIGEAMVEQRLSDFRALRARWEERGDARDRLRSFVRMTVDNRRQLARSGCPIGSLALELHEADPAVRERLAENFTAWVAAVRGCYEEAEERFPAGTDVQALAELTLTVMEGGVMQARTHRDIGPFDRGVEQLRRHIDLLTQAHEERNAA